MKFFGTWLALVLGFVASATSFAAPATSVVSAEERQALLHPWDFTLSMAHYESLYNENDGNRLSANTMTNALGYKINGNYKLIAELDLLQDVLNSENNDIAGAALKLKHSEIPFADRVLLLTPALSTDIPVSKYDHHIGSQGTIGVSMKAAINPRFLISKRLSVGVSAGAKRYFNTYTEAQDGSPNVEYGSSQEISLGWEFNRWFSFAFAGDHYDYWSYNGILQEYYGHSEEFDFTLNKIWQIAVGHSYGNPLMPFVPVWKADGSDSNFSLFNEQYSTVYAQITVTF